MPLKLKREVRIKSDNTKIKIVKKYLFISLKSKLIFVKSNLFMYMFFGLLNERIWFIEYLNNEYSLMNLRPELVEKKDPPIITKIKNIKFKFGWLSLIEKPILDILLEIDKRLFENCELKLKNRKNIVKDIIR